MDSFEVKVNFKYDTSVLVVDCEQVYRTISKDEFNDISIFWVWKNKKNNKPILSTCEGVLFIGETSKPPQMFFSDKVTKPPRRQHSFTVVHDQPAAVEQPSHFRKRVEWLYFLGNHIDDTLDI